MEPRFFLVLNTKELANSDGIVFVLECPFLSFDLVWLHNGDQVRIILVAKLFVYSVGELHAPVIATSMQIRSITMNKQEKSVYLVSGDCIVRLLIPSRCSLEGSNHNLVG